MVDWRSTVQDEVAPAFEKQTGIKIDFTFLPLDALATRLKAQLTGGSSDIDVAQFSADYGWIGHAWPTTTKGSPTRSAMG